MTCRDPTTVRRFRPPSAAMGLLPVPVLLVLMVVLDIAVEPTVFYDPPWLVFIANTLFVGVVGVVVAAIASRNYAATGIIQVLLLGCAMLVSGIGAVVAAWVRGLPDGANLTVTIHNTGALLSACLHFAAAFVLAAALVREAAPERRRLLLTLGYGGAVLFMVLLTAAVLADVVPAFFVQGVGPTALRQWVLQASIWLFAFASLMFMATYLRSRERFLYWYAGGLALTAINLAAVSMQQSVGSPVGWLGRGALYLGGIYFLVALVVAGRTARARGSSLDDVLAASLTGAEERFRAAFTNAAIGFSMTTPAGRYVDANPALCALTGYSLAELRALTFQQLLHPDDRAASQVQTGRMLSGEIAGFTVENRYVRRDRQPVWVRKSVSLVRDPRGLPRWVVALVEDVTERKRAEAALRDSEARYRTLHEGMRDAFVQVSMDGRIVACNDIYCRMLGYSADELRALNYTELTPEAWHAFEDDIVRRQIVPRGYSEVYEKEYVRKDGTVVPVELRTVLSRDASGRPSAMWALVRDISERRKAEEDHRLLQAELSRASRLSEIGRMAAALAHELNQPLTAVVSYISGCRRMLQALDVPDEPRARLRGVLEQVSAQALRAGEIIRRLREFIGTGEGERTIEGVAGVIREGAMLATAAARHAGVQIRFDVDTPARVLLDKIQIQQVVFNLMRNAVEAMESTPRKEMKVETSVTGDRVEVRVSDTGAGIAPEIAGRLFKPFSTTKADGMGIGLSVCREIVEAHGGKIWAEPNPGGGTVFRFTLPLLLDEAAV